ncbi:hypothetical protein RHMOL_Rhmol13G0235000 [Rhododendron molle]|uniref:Uncharacterized protein n=1 Tax=Rhododendron molle TaxID=49168 RepID=A0ACC0LAB4_RHOML|nr:hypothetical protein RHMOL_Rhmol13G0235000 [Rhododendron molle]
MMTITTTAMRTAMKKARDLERMVVHAPFLRWDKIPNPSPLSSFTVASYFLETAEGKQVIAAFAVSGSDNRMVYQPSHEFVEDYEGVFNLGCVTFHFCVFLYDQLLRFCCAGVDQCWYLKKLSMPGVIERLPRALHQYFATNGSSTWILLRHAWLNGMLAEHHRGMLCNQCLAGSGMGGSPNFAPKQLQYLLDLLTWGMALRLKGKVAVQFQSLQIL